MTTKQQLTQFLEFLVSLAPEGETALIVKQKPQRRDGELQFHADGAVKCTWPAFLPDAKRIKDGDSWYGNTASFVLDRFKEGHVSASAANCEYCLVLVLDDVGTKSKTPALPPTWVMETSKGSFQWGYAFTEEQPTKAQFAAAIKAIADAGYTDPGAINAVRNFRLPGSVNLKPNRNGWAARLVEFHPDRMFTLPEICNALRVTPAEASSVGPRPIRVHDTGTDDVFRWLSDQSLVLSKPNPEGWAGIICPNHAQHTDGNPEGRYMPATRAYCCLHAHCLEFDTKAFLQWVADNGGPEHEPGVRDDLMASVMTDTLQKLQPSEFFTDDAKKVIEEVERKELGRLEKAQWFQRFAYVQNDDSYFDLQERREVSRGTFNALFRHITCTSIHNNRRIEASVCFDENRQAMGAHALVGVTYAAGESVLVSRGGDVHGNRWRDARPTPGTGDVTPWLEHCRVLVPEPAELEHLFDVMAYKVQHPEVKINHAVLHGGTQGCGKDTLWAPFIWSVCGPTMQNRGLLDNDTLGSQWGYQLESEVLILNELREPEARERRALANKLKPIIAAPPETLPVNRKGLHPYDMVNRMFVLAFTNDPVPITIDSQDRRWFCVWSHAPRMDPDRARALWSWYNAGGFAAVAGWLHARDVSAFNPAAAPIVTEFKQNLVEHGMSMAESYLVELIRRRQGEFARGVVGSPFHSLCDRLAGSAPAGVKVPQAALLHALRESGWQDMGRLSSADYQSKKHIFAAPDVAASHKKSELRRMVEDGAGGSGGARMVAVK
jgi:hypothetical protein